MSLVFICVLNMRSALWRVTQSKCELCLQIWNISAAESTATNGQRPPGASYLQIVLQNECLLMGQTHVNTKWVNPKNTTSTDLPYTQVGYLRENTTQSHLGIDVTRLINIFTN